VLSFRAIRARIEGNLNAIGRDVLRRSLVTLPTHFGHGLIGNALTPLAAGGRIVLPPSVGLAENLGRVIDSYEISFMSSVPAIWQRAIRQPRPVLQTLRRIHIGSAPLKTALWSDVASWSGAEVVNCYGLTETANWVAGASSRLDGIGQGLMGKPWGVRVAVKDDNGLVSDTGEGEILLGSPAAMSGYLDRPELTAAVLHDGWFHTGDRGRVDAQGSIWLTGRIKEEINRAGFKVQPSEIDLLLESHPRIAEACVFGIADPVSEEIVAAAIRPEPGEELVQQELVDWCRERLRREAIPERWFFVGAIPRNERGKVSRAAVRQMVVPSEDGASNVMVAPRGNSPSKVLSQRIRQTVENAWVEVLGQASFDRNESWDIACEDSLDALRLLFGMETALDIRLTFDVMQPGAGPVAIAEAVARTLDLPVADHSADAPLVFFFPPLEGDMPHISAFRTRFGDRFRFAVIQYPSSREIIDAERSFDVFTDFAVSQLQTFDKQELPFFFCVSSGGFVAWEVARRLTGSGGEVGFIGLIDTRRGEAVHETSQPAGCAVTKNIVDPLTLTHRLRRQALDNLVVAPLDVPVTLFRSDPLVEGSIPWSGSPDYGWSDLCSDLTIVNVEGSHATILNAPNDEFLSQRMTEALESILRFRNHEIASPHLRVQAS
jgi:thioesterase domain-containing protein